MNSFVMQRARGPSRPFLGALSLSLLAVTFALCRLRPIYWEDVWWHLGVGQYILAHHGIPTTDVFSWTVWGAPWINTEWLYEVILYGFVHVMGLAGVVFLKTALMLVALYFVDRRLRLWKGSVFERLLFLSITFLGAWPFWVERADLTSLALLSALFFDINRKCFDAGGGWKRGIVWVFLFALWPNIHGAYPIGLAVIGLHGILEYPRRPASGRRIILWTVLYAAATLTNPYGIGLPIGIFRNMSGNLNQVSEWLPPTGLGFLFFFLSLGLSLLSFAFKKPWTWDTVYEALIVLLFAIYALLHERFVHFFMICAFPYAARHWIESRWRTRLSGRLIAWEKTTLAVTSAILFMTSVTSARLIQGGVDAIASGYVERACDFIESQKIQGPFYNDYKFGSYWIWRFKGNPPVFQDGRHASVLGYDDLIEKSQEAQKSPQTWNAYIDRLGVQAALVRYPSMAPGIRPSVLDRYFPRSTWGLLYWDDQCLLYVRRTSRRSALLRRFEYRVMKPDWTLETFQDQLQRGLLDRRAVRREIERNLAINPACRRAQVDLYWLDHVGLSQNNR